ncbi:pyridoxamine 5'-phosphate oxidase family protein [Methanobrevibacter sp.]|uniref:pyridoxamine 5'-phosphate oxidase family protein n=1 Tax=Methanobrevibacter sp. TaxID=66852 RepID=UPI003890A23E
MFRKMRRYKQELTEEECIDILTTEPRGVLALLGDEDYPYAIPMSHVYADGKIYFHGAKEGHKNDAVKKYPKASYCIVDEGIKNEDEWWYTFKSVIVFGKIRTIDENSAKIDKLRHLGNKFFPTPEETEKEIKRLLDRTEVFELTIEHISGKITVEK